MPAAVKCARAGRFFPMSETLEQAITDERGDAAVLRRRGHGKEADLIERLCDRFAAAAEDYITFISEADAQLRSGNSKDWFRNRFVAWEREGLARWNPHGRRQRQYRRCIVPQRTNLEAVKADASRTAEGESRVAS